MVSQPFDENTYLVAFPDSDKCLVIDPGFEPDKVNQALVDHKWQPAAILNTHGHSDHIAGNQDLKQRFPDVPLVIGAGDAYKLTDADANLSAPFGVALLSPPADKTVTEGDVIEFARIPLQVLETPGHSAGHVVFVWHPDEGPKVVFGGDVLFRGSIGRTDFPDGNMQHLLSAVHTKLFPLPDDTVVYPGHGPETTILEEKEANPFVGKPSGWRPS